MPRSGTSGRPGHLEADDRCTSTRSSPPARRWARPCDNGRVIIDVTGPRRPLRERGVFVLAEVLLSVAFDDGVVVVFLPPRRAAWSSSPVPLTRSARDGSRDMRLARRITELASGGSSRMAGLLLHRPSRTGPSARTAIKIPAPVAADLADLCGTTLRRPSAPSRLARRRHDRGLGSCDESLGSRSEPRESPGRLPPPGLDLLVGRGGDRPMSRS
jgi:hypothetical protein